MINLTKLNGKTFLLNVLFIETVESFPDTTITLTNGNKYVVKEKEEEVQNLINRFYQKVNLFGLPGLGEEENEE
ncbi:flagellar FlbD family protein [Bacillus sp. B1-b2]|uniref:flagellar FlbD family protein n=1 Tax=Bacillus sp. B1-b2 TaxID=2653201 RepID=UPI001262504B|nr:flagellar FlbD family protein [Bacillus sp. B1-b2]KAB7668646.1 flagellar FlbD family protein [Bacillus sp. B1-b2]